MACMRVSVNLIHSMRQQMCVYIFAGGHISDCKCCVRSADNLDYSEEESELSNETMVIDGTMMMTMTSYSSSEPLPLLSLNHVSLLVQSLWASVRFYEEVLGFCLVQRPSSFNFHGAWLFNYGIGIHLLEDDQSIDDEYYAAVATPRPIDPKDNHISFECTDVELAKRRLEEMGVRYVTTVVEDGGVVVEQVFFHDPDGYMIEICNCNNFPILPIYSGSLKPPELFWSAAGVRREDGEPEP